MSIATYLRALTIFKRFRLHLRNEIGAGMNVANEILPLPLNKTVVEVFADFLKYLLNCAANCIKERHTNVPDLWRSVENGIGFILPHPKGWESTQQQEMRKAAVAARLIPDNPSGHARLAFVSEGEATLYFSIHNGLPSWALKDGHGVVVVEAGRRAINISFYNRNTPEGEKESFDEVADTQCHFYGSEVVTINARKFIGGSSPGNM